MECATCGLTPFDLPDGVDPEYVFERVNGETYCQADAPSPVSAATGETGEERT